MTGDVTKNPCFMVELKLHCLDLEACRIKCFDVFNTMSVSVAHAGEYDMAAI